MSNFRDDKLKVNDDRKICMNLSEFTEPGTQVLFFVRTNDLRGETDIPPNQFDEAWFRLQNDQTNQTLDYSKISKIELPEDYNEDGEGADEDEDAPKQRNELIYVVGRVYREDVNPRTNRIHGSPKWIYEKWDQVVTSAKFPNIHQTLADLYLRSINDQKFYAEQI